MQIASMVMFLVRRQESVSCQLGQVMASVEKQLKIGSGLM
jgi:hypothetical protein